MQENEWSGAEDHGPAQWQGIVDLQGYRARYRRDPELGLWLVHADAPDGSSWQFVTDSIAEIVSILLRRVNGERGGDSAR